MSSSTKDVTTIAGAGCVFCIHHPPLHLLLRMDCKIAVPHNSQPTSLCFVHSSSLFQALRWCVPHFTPPTTPTSRHLHHYPPPRHLLCQMYQHKCTNTNVPTQMYQHRCQMCQMNQHKCTNTGTQVLRMVKLHSRWWVMYGACPSWGLATICISSNGKNFLPRCMNNLFVSWPCEECQTNTSFASFCKPWVFLLPCVKLVYLCKSTPLNKHVVVESNVLHVLSLLYWFKATIV